MDLPDLAIDWRFIVAVFFGLWWTMLILKHWTEV